MTSQILTLCFVVWTIAMPPIVTRPKTHNVVLCPHCQSDISTMVDHRTGIRMFAVILSVFVVVLIALLVFGVIMIRNSTLSKVWLVRRSITARTEITTLNNMKIKGGMNHQDKQLFPLVPGPLNGFEFNTLWPNDTAIDCWREYWSIKNIIYGRIILNKAATTSFINCSN